MKTHLTVVYYDGIGGHVGAFHVINADKESLFDEFYNHEISTIKCITIETSAWNERRFKTIFTESDIKNFLEEWGIDF